MLEKLFLSVLNMSITASWVIVAILLVRLVLRRLPSKYSYMLWAAAGFRLICPVSVSSVVSLFNLKNFSAARSGNQMEYVPADIGYAMQPQVDLGAAAVNEAVNGSLPAGNAAASVNPLQIWIFAGSWIWILGIAVLVILALVSLFRTKKKICLATRFSENVFECENIPSPFVLGLLHPRIYIPYRLLQKDREYILSHERFHIRRFDHWTKLLAFALLVLHWFNPLVWIAYFQMGKDMEMSCDEAVVSGFDSKRKSEYGELLLSFAVNRRHFSPGPLAFGESDVAKRIKNVLRFQNPRVWTSVVGIIVVAVIAAACMTNGNTEGQEESVSAVTAEIGEEDFGSTDNSQIAPNSESQTLAVVESQLQQWAAAFCERDGQTLLEMCTDEVKWSFVERDLLFVGEEGVSFGMSSPWPWQPGADYMILEPVDNTASILYFAQTSDPHVTVWRETVSYQVLEDSILVESEELRTMDYISSMEEFIQAYPRGIDGAEMDYLANGMGEALNNNALLSSSFFYNDLFEPDRAAIFLLNLLDNPNKVQIREHVANQDGSVELQIYFAEDGGTVYLLMIQPYGQQGIWIPQDMVQENTAVQTSDLHSALSTHII